MKLLFPVLFFILSLTSCFRTDLDSLLIFFISSGQVYSVDSDGKKIKRLTNDARVYQSVNSSMDGENLLLSDDAGKMYLMDYDGGPTSFLALGKYGTYGPSGKIYFTLKGGSFYNVIARCNSDGSNIVHLKVMAVDVDIYSLSISPDEKELAIHYWQSGPSYSAKMDLVTLANPVNLTNTGDNPAFSPQNNSMLSKVTNDNIRITYPDTTYFNVYTSAFSTLGQNPAWSPDGEYIFFSYAASNPKEIIRIKTDGTGATTIATFSTTISGFCVHGKPR